MKFTVLSFALLLVTAAYADTDMGNMNMMGSSSASSESSKKYLSSMHSSMMKMNHDMMSAPMNGNPDHDFAAMMIPHHQGGIDMAKLELQCGKDPEMRKLAENIIAAQKKEIEQMRAWLKTDAAKPAQGK
jgi:uncharacterized protein (DUF305 family)